VMGDVWASQPFLQLSTLNLKIAVHNIPVSSISLPILTLLRLSLNASARTLLVHS